MSQDPGATTGKTPRWFRGVRTRQGALTYGAIYLLLATGFVALAIAQSGPTRWFYAIGALGFLLISLAGWSAARRMKAPSAQSRDGRR